LLVSKDDLEPLRKALPEHLRRRYASDRTISETLKALRASEPSYTAKDLLETYAPTTGSVASGEFAELLTFLLLVEWRSAEGVEKWRWKIASGKPLPFTDVILFALANAPDASPEDLLLSAEVKAKATDTDGHPLQDALDDANKDRVSRLAKTLVWLRARYLQDGDGVRAKAIERFINSVDLGEFRREIKAVAVIDADLLAGELSKSLNTPDGAQGVELVALGFPELKQTYEGAFGAIPSTWTGEAQA